MVDRRIDEVFQEWLGGDEKTAASLQKKAAALLKELIEGDVLKDLPEKRKVVATYLAERILLNVRSTSDHIKLAFASKYKTLLVLCGKLVAIPCELELTGGVQA